MIYSPDTQDARMLGVRDDIDSGGGPGALQICTAGYALVLASVVLGYPGNATGTVSNGVLTLAGLPRQDVSADATGVPAVARVRNSLGADIITGLTVGLSNADVIVNTLDFKVLFPVTVGSASFTHSASS